MAIFCKGCGKEIDALSGGRCRKCRQLVCHACIAEGAIGSAEGILCRICRETPVDTSPEKEETPPPPPLYPFTLVPRWGWLSLAIFLLLLFFWIVGYPALYARMLAQRIEHSNPREAEEAAEALVTLGGHLALKHLEKIAKEGSLPARLLAIRAMGRFPSPEVLDSLRSLTALPDLEEDLRLALQEAIHEHERRFPPESASSP